MNLGSLCKECKFGSTSKNKSVYFTLSTNWKGKIIGYLNSYKKDG